MLNLLLLFQTTSVEILNPLASLGVGGALGGLIFHFYRKDREASEQRYSALALDFRKLITENTAALTHLSDAIDRKMP